MKVVSMFAEVLSEGGKSGKDCLEYYWRVMEVPLGIAGMRYLGAFLLFKKLIKTNSDDSTKQERFNLHQY